ncbi:MAG: helix-turn-helix transcriptional regulator [Nitrospirales bacterium]|nr:helix-turn-helix domain-containing protein [Nitrospirales bacterium]
MSSKETMTFGHAISRARKDKGWALKDLACRVLREDGDAISPQYLNDIEHDRRSPSSDRMVKQFAEALEIDADWLYYLAGRFPEDVRKKSYQKMNWQKQWSPSAGVQRIRGDVSGEIGYR